MSLDDVLGSRAQRLLGDQIGAAEDQGSRLRVLQEHAREWLGAAAPEDSAAETVRRMLEHASRTTVAEMAEATGLCARQLNLRCVCGPEVRISSDAPEQDRLLAFLGRNP
ncbi:hypothetical protein ACWDKQ_04640 [Saccharopolyspora sp. NPDC000995]